MKLKSKVARLYYKMINFVPWRTAKWYKFDTTSPLWPVGYICSNCNFISGNKPKRCPKCKAKMKNAE